MVRSKDLIPAAGFPLLHPKTPSQCRSRSSAGLCVGAGIVPRGIARTMPAPCSLTLPKPSHPIHSHPSHSLQRALLITPLKWAEPLKRRKKFLSLFGTSQTGFGRRRCWWDGTSVLLLSPLEGLHQGDPALCVAALILLLNGEII